MIRKLAVPLTIACALVLLAFGTADANGVFQPVSALVHGISSSPAQSVIDVVLHSQNYPFVLRGTLTLVVVDPSGVTQYVTRTVLIPPGNSIVKVYVNHAVAKVNFPLVKNVSIP